MCRERCNPQRARSLPCPSLVCCVFVAMKRAHDLNIIMRLFVSKMQRLLYHCTSHLPKRRPQRAADDRSIELKGTGARSGILTPSHRQFSRFWTRKQKKKKSRLKNRNIFVTFVTCGSRLWNACSFPYGDISGADSCFCFKGRPNQSIGRRDPINCRHFHQ